jgi:3-hydroxyisobutyrate dehydrogenase
MANQVGWIGLGRMGEAMVKRLLKAGFTASVWNRTRSKAEPLAEYGAEIVRDKTDLAACDVVFTMVSTTDDLKEVLFGAGGLVTGARKPQVVVDSSSISQEGSAEIRAQLEGLGVAYLCAPVSGNAKVAKAGKLLIVASGRRRCTTRRSPTCRHGPQGDVGGRGRTGAHLEDRAQHHVRRDHPEPVRDHGAGEKAGIPRHVFLESINDSVLGSMYTRYKTPMLTNLTFDQVTFTPKLLLKDMDLGMGAAKAHGVAMPAAAATRESVARMVGRGYDHIDFAVLLQETARDAGLELKPENVQMGDGLES